MVTDQSEPCQLFRNRGGESFEDVAPELGLSLLHIGGGFVKGAAWGDFDNDGRPDLYLSMMGGWNRLLRNGGADDTGKWHFEDATTVAGVAAPFMSFPVVWFDMDNDGWLDLLVAGFCVSDDAAGVAALHMQMPRAVEEHCRAVGESDDEARSHQDTPRLYINNRNGTFRRLNSAALDSVLAAMGMNVGDLDNDGYEDVYFGTGTPALGVLIPNRLLRNEAGSGFQDVTAASNTGHLQKGHGVAIGGTPRPLTI